MRGIAQIGLKQSLEFEQGLLVENHVVEIFRLQSRMRKTELNSVLWKSLVMLLPGKAFFLCRCNYVAIDHERCCGVMVERRDSQDGL